MPRTARDAPAPTRRLRLGERWLDLDAGVLRDAAGAPVALRPQAFALLCLLARHAGEVVGKQQMFDAVWPGLVVTDGSIAQAVKDVRSALGADGHRLVRTVARRGYLLVDADAAGAAQRSPWPADAGPLFGRTDELLRLDALLDAARAVTVLGPGGVGKTRLARAAVQARIERTHETVAWVDLAPLGDPRLVAIEVAQALRLPVNHGDEPLLGLQAALVQAGDALLVLDNAEHLVDAVAALVGVALAQAPGLRFLVTSQSPLHLEAERLLRLRPLPLPAADDSTAQALASPAVALFVDRVRAIDDRFVVTAENVAAVVALCRRLDGLPLALRLAAGRVHLLGLAGLSAQLADGLQSLGTREAGTPARQQTLAAALGWSHGLLSVPEQTLYRRLGVCAGGFDVELALALCADAMPDRAEAIERLAGLVDRSLVNVDADGARFFLFDSQRRFAEAALRDAGEFEAARARHCDALTARLRAANDEQLYSASDDECIADWGREIDNLRAALGWSLRHDALRCACLFAEAYPIFVVTGRAPELRRFVPALDADTVARMDPASGARFRAARAILEQGHDAALAHEHASMAVALYRRCSDVRGLYRALCLRLITACVPPDEIDGVYAEIEALQQPDWPARLLSLRHTVDYTLASLRRAWPAACAAADAGLEHARDAGLTLNRSVFLHAAIVSRIDAGDLDGAWQRCRAWRASVGTPATSVMRIPFVGTTARVALRLGELDAARASVEELIYLCRAVDWTYFDTFAALYPAFALAEGRVEDAARLLGHAASAVQRAWGRPPERTSLEPTRERLEALLGASALEALRLAGTALDREAVCRLVLRPRNAVPEGAG